LRAREREREQGRDLEKEKQGLEAGVFNIPLLLAIEANTQLKVGIWRKALFLYKKVQKNGMLHLSMFRGCNRCWYVHWVNVDHNRDTNSALGVG
jgi:hypothetical protein